MYDQKADGELITIYLDQQDQRAFEFLLRRYHGKLRARIIRKGFSDDVADDLMQTLWIRVLDHLPEYKDNNQFSNFTNKIATNLMKDHWRKVAKESLTENLSIDQQFTEDSDQSDYVTLLDFEKRDAVNHLTHQLIPSLSCDLRLVYLLRHESEFWEAKRPLQWPHLANLNGVTIEEIWADFKNARAKLIATHSRQDEATELEPREVLVFLVWTQAQRPRKEEKFTEKDFADLLNMPVNSFKTRYRTAVKQLAEGLAPWR